MAYGHAERNLAAIRELEADTRQLLGSMAQLDQEQSAWLESVSALPRSGKDFSPARLHASGDAAPRPR